MGCQTEYSCPITIPMGLPGTGGDPGDNGTDGVAIIENTMGTTYTSSGTGDQSLQSYTLTGGTMGAKDILDIEVIYDITSSFAGELYINFGASKVATFTASVSDAFPPGPVANTMVTFHVKLYFKTVGTQTYITVYDIYGSPLTIIKRGPTNISVNSASDVVIDVRTNASAGTAYAKSMVLTHYKKV